jgi:Ser/Thr protein kinase RdoA (MazF antagonist)
VVRVTLGGTGLREARSCAEREVSVARHLEREKAPIVSPAPGALAGPHQVGDLTLSLWLRVELRPGEPDPKESGRRLARCHAALRGYRGPSPPLGGLERLERLLGDPAVQHAPAEERKLVMRQSLHCRRMLEARSGSFQPLHGDAQIRNVLHTPAGPLWTDWEDGMAGPREWDLACLVSAARVLGRQVAWSEEALRAYGPHDAELLELCIHARTLCVVAWLWARPRDAEDVEDRLRPGLAWLRQRPAT